MKSTKVCNVENGCIVQVTTQQRNPDGSYAVAEALTYVPGMNIDKTANPRVLKPIEIKPYSSPMSKEVTTREYEYDSDNILTKEVITQEYIKR
jgi:hypothetical protein